jgi:hypothetical protein
VSGRSNAPFFNLFCPPVNPGAVSGLVPPWLNKAEFTADIDDVQNVLPIKNLADQVQEAIYNISYLAGNEAYHWILDYYHSARQAANRDVPNAKIVADELGKRFKSRGRKSSKPAD